MSKEKDLENKIAIYKITVYPKSRNESDKSVHYTTISEKNDWLYDENGKRYTYNAAFVRAVVDMTKFVLQTIIDSDDNAASFMVDIQYTTLEDVTYNDGKNIDLFPIDIWNLIGLISIKDVLEYTGIDFVVGFGITSDFIRYLITQILYVIMGSTFDSKYSGPIGKLIVCDLEKHGFIDIKKMVAGREIAFAEISEATV
jgi:hypothetical protein